MSTPYSASIIVSPAGNGQAGVTISPGGLPGPVPPGIFYLDSYGGGTDDQKMASALAAAQAAGGGTIAMPPRTVTLDNQLATAYSTAGNIRITGPGALPGVTGEGAPKAAATLVLNYAGAGAARMDFQHDGAIEIDHLLIQDTAGSTVPFFQTTEAVPYLHDLAFTGSQTGTACNQDAIYLGGTGTTEGGGDTAPFNAYQGVIERVIFYGIRRCVKVQTFANSISMRDLMIDASCGAANVFAVTDGAMTATSATLTCASSAPFTSGMVGQVIAVAGAGAGQQNFLLLATIAAFSSSSAVTLSQAAVNTVSGATVTAPSAAAIEIGIPGEGVEGVTVNDSCIELNNYPIGVMLQGPSQDNALLGTSFWDGGAANLGSIAAIGQSTGNIFIIPQNNQHTGVPALIEENPGHNTIFAPSLGAPYFQFGQGITFQGTAPVRIMGAGSAGGARIGFGPANSNTDDLQLFRDANGDLQVTLGFSASSQLLLNSAQGLRSGNAANYVTVGPETTADAWVDAGGSNATVNLQLRSHGSASCINLNSHLAAAGLSGAPAIAANAAAGSGPAVSVSGNDVRGTITITTGTSPAAGDLATITYHASYAGTGTPFVVVSGDGTTAALAEAAAALQPATALRSATVFHLVVANAPAASTTYTFNYAVIG